jgi:hypothetical protein
MPQPREVDEAVLHLGKKEAWRLNELPEGIANERMMRELGVKGYVDAHVWVWFNPNPSPVTHCVKDPKPLREQPWGLWRPLLKIEDWKRVMGLGGDRPYVPGEIRLNDFGLSRFACLQEAEGGQGGGGAGKEPAKRPGQPRKSKRGKAKELTKKQAAVVELVDVQNQNFPAIAGLWKKTTQSVQQLYERARKNPAYKQRSVSLKKTEPLHSNTCAKGLRSRDE